ncbi:uncharacterized protein [Petaurus breviceps papuanus]|uniref:uncharacterized protein n=1 Tax=Petaurus breviceps papuanus TaxID=3040969 RepID=UPI0036DDC3BC
MAVLLVLCLSVLMLFCQICPLVKDSPFVEEVLEPGCSLRSPETVLQTESEYCPLVRDSAVVAGVWRLSCRQNEYCPLVKDSAVVAGVWEPFCWFRSPEEGFSCCMFTEILGEGFANVFRGSRTVLQTEDEFMKGLAMYLMALLSLVSPGTKIAENLPPVKMKKRPPFGAEVLPIGINSTSIITEGDMTKDVGRQILDILN